MYTIYLNSEARIVGNFESFKQEMISVCNDHRDKNRAMAFAMILYDFENPHLLKILEDDHYWQALNKISGKYLTVFSINYSPSTKRYSSNPSMEYLTAFSFYDDPEEASNELIEMYFGNIEVSYPSILFFQVDKNEVVDSLLIELKEEKVEAAFIELKKYLNAAVESLKQIEDENRNNIVEIFDRMEENVKSINAFGKVKRVIRTAGEFINLLLKIKSLIP